MLGTEGTIDKSHSGKLQIAQAAGRLESKRRMKQAAYAKLDRLIFELHLAFADGARELSFRDALGRSGRDVFNRYDFLTYDASYGGFYYDTDYYLDDKVTLTSIELPGLGADTEYTVEVYGVNSEFCSSRDNPEALLTEPLTATFKTFAAGEEARDGANLVDLDLSGFTPKNAAENGLLTNVLGDPQILYDPRISKDALNVNGFNNDVVIFGSYSSFASTLRDSMTFEICFKVDRLPTTAERTFGIASSQQLGGFGLQVDPDSTATFWIGDTATGGYAKLTTKIETSVYHHLIATFDGSKCTLYLDGKEVTSVNMGGLKLSSSSNAWYIYLGGDPDGSGGIAIPSECSISLFRLYSYDLTREEVMEIYNQQ
jgi:hypothetical protein